MTRILATNAETNMATSPMEKVTNNSDSGYCKMPDGTLIQWGEKVIPSGNNYITISFPIPFASVGYSIQALGNYANTRHVSFVYSSLGQSSVDIYRSTDTNNYDQTFRYIAIGRWK